MPKIDAIDLHEIFDSLTDKQREALALLAEGWTSKEIATQLGVSESAVVQRIEAVRAKAGGLLRKDLARIYRSYETDDATNCNGLTGKINQVPGKEGFAQKSPQDHCDPELHMADVLPFEVPHPWADFREPRVVPEVLEGKGATLTRLAAAATIAVALSTGLLVLFAVADSLGDLF